MNRLQKLAGIKELNVNKPSIFTIQLPYGWDEYESNENNDINDMDLYGGEVIKLYCAPSDGWDDSHTDQLRVIKKKDGKYYLNISYSFGDHGLEKGPFTQSQIKQAILNQMEEISEDWDNEGFENEEYE